MPTAPNAQNYQDYTTLTLRDYSDRCREIGQYSGVESRGEKDFGKVLEVLNRDSHLNLDPVDMQLFTMVFSELGRNARRYGGDAHMNPEFGENSATHSSQCVVLADSAFQKARLDSSPETAKLQHEIRLGLMLHDIGEAFGEFSSLAQRATAGTEEASGDIERDVFQYVFKLAGHAIETGDETVFYDTMKRITDQAQVAKDGDGAAGGLSDILKANPVPDISEKLQERIDGFLDLYDAAEMKKGEDFFGYAIKAIEHNQGTRHLLRFAENANGDKSGFLARISDGIDRSAQLPFDTSPSYRCTRNHQYLEGEIGDLFVHAKTPEEKQLAKALRDQAYETAIECIENYRPVVNRFATPETPEKPVEYRSSHPDPVVRQQVLETAKQESGYAATLAQHRSERSASQGEDGAGNHQLFAVETRQRLVALYRNAIKRDYTPKPKENLFGMKELPKDLAPLFPEREIARTGRGR